MDTQEARKLGQTISGLVGDGHIRKAYDLLAPVLTERIAFRLLDYIGASLGAVQPGKMYPFLDHIAEAKTMGGWVVIATALAQQLAHSLPKPLNHCRKYIIAADVWYATDILGERVPGPALLRDFDRALALLEPWRADGNRWVRRAVGVTVHFWAKRMRGKSDQLPRVRTLLAFLVPMFEERDMDAVKGVGWGLKTLGKYHPNLVSEWLTEQVIHRRSNPRVLLLRKAMTYLPDENRTHLT